MGELVMDDERNFFFFFKVSKSLTNLNFFSFNLRIFYFSFV